MEAGYQIASSFSHLAHKNGKSLQAILGDDFEPLSSGEELRSIGRLRQVDAKRPGKTEASVL